MGCEVERDEAHYKFQNSLFDPLFSALSTVEPEDGPARKRARLDEDAKGELSAVVMDACRAGESAKIVSTKLGRRLFEVASEETTKDSNRRKMYALWKAVGADADDESDDE